MSPPSPRAQGGSLFKGTLLWCSFNEKPKVLGSWLGGKPKYECLKPDRGTPIQQGTSGGGVTWKINLLLEKRLAGAIVGGYPVCSVVVKRSQWDVPISRIPHLETTRLTNPRAFISKCGNPQSNPSFRPLAKKAYALRKTYMQWTTCANVTPPAHGTTKDYPLGFVEKSKGPTRGP